MNNVESLWMEQQKARYRQEHALDRWRSLALTFLVWAICATVCAGALLVMKLP
jgi:hypothetical protein